MNNSLEEKKDVEVPCQTEDAFNYDEILGYLGQMGKFQFRSFLLLCLPAVFFGPVIMIYVFIGAIPRYRYVHRSINPNFNHRMRIIFYLVI